MKNLLMIWMICFFGACGTTGPDNTPENNVTDPGDCDSFGEEGDAVFVCTLRSPIQETGFLCPEGAPYLFEFEAAAVCSENPDLRESQRREVVDGGVAECDSSSSEFCVAVEPSQQRLNDCANWLAFATDCTTADEFSALETACEDAATGAATSDWTFIGDCTEVMNGSSEGMDDFCPIIAGCIARELRVCNQHNDECWSIRGGREGTCDNLEGLLDECNDATMLGDLVASCEVAATDATDTEFAEIESCLEFANNASEGNTLCDDRTACMTTALAPF